MAEPMKQSLQPSEQIGDEEKKFNRQINYFIMRHMWQVICGRSSTDTIYNSFQTSRVRYTRVIDTGVIRYGKGELDGLQQLTGLRKEIFTGEARFQCPYQRGKDMAEITEADWKKMFDWRKCRTGENTQDKICAVLKEVARTNVENNDFYRLCYFLRERKPAPVRSASDKLRGAVREITGLSFEVLDNCDVGQLGALKKLLNEKLKLVNGIYTYKEEKTKAKKEK